MRFGGVLIHKNLSQVRPGVVYTPWGQSQRIDQLGDSGAIVVSTASHGGAWIPKNLYDQLPEGLRKTPYSDGGWFEEDQDIAIPFAFFGEIFGTSPDRIKFAREAVVRAFPGRVPRATIDKWKEEKSALVAA